MTISSPVISLSAAAWLKDVDFLGLYVPSIVLWAILACLPFIVLRWLIFVSGLYRFLWHRPLFNMALYILILSSVILSGVWGWL
jgi:hypothetical protein